MKNVEGKPYVVLHSIQHGSSFYSYMGKDVDKERDHTKLIDGTVAYRVMGFVDTPEEAQAILRNENPRVWDALDKFEEKIKKGDHEGAIQDLFVALPEYKTIHEQMQKL